MSGISANLGFVYQNKILLFHLIDFLSKEVLLECRFEICIDPETEIDIKYLIRSEKAALHHFYEVKNIEKLKNSHIKATLENFHRSFSGISTESLFTLVHSAQIEGPIKKLYPHLTSTANKRRYVTQLVPQSQDEFIKRVNAKQVIDGNQCGILRGHLDFYTIELIDNILRERFGIKKYGVADIIFKTMYTTFANLMRVEEEKLKQLRLGAARKKACVLDLKTLFSERNSFIDNIAQYLRIANEAAEAKFVERFKLDYGLDEKASYLEQ